MYTLRKVRTTRGCLEARALVCVCEHACLCGVVGRGSGLLGRAQFSVQLEQSLLPDSAILLACPLAQADNFARRVLLGRRPHHRTGRCRPPLCDDLTHLFVFVDRGRVFTVCSARFMTSGTGGHPGLSNGWRSNNNNCRTNKRHQNTRTTLRAQRP